MQRQLAKEVESTLSGATGISESIIDVAPVSGGCINQTWIVTTLTGSRFFVKSNSNFDVTAFEIEAAGLNALRKTGHLRIPAVVGFGSCGKSSFLILEAIVQSRQGPNFMENLGRGLANVHSANHSRSFGWDKNNFIGATPQPNTNSKSWVDFWRTNRLEFQLRLAGQNGYAGELTRLGGQMCEKLEQWICEQNVSPCLIHGDLWSGNYLADEAGHPVLIDPAVYFAHNEAEFGMISLFGGVSEQFYDAYQEVIPLADGSDDRIAIYRLYHLLNHLNLFGASYLGGCMRILRRMIV